MARTWIKLESPQIALNAPNVKKFIMKYSLVVPNTMSPDQMFAKVPNDVKHLIFNCHGHQLPAPYLSIGTHIDSSHITGYPNPFVTLANILTLRVIWISACALASSPAGEEIIKGIGNSSACYVVSEVMAVPDVAVRANCIEDYSNSMPKYCDPDGNWMSRGDFFALGPKLGFGIA